RTRDANMHHLAGMLTERGIDLKEVRIVSDVHEDIVAAVNALRSRWDHVFTSGGIGPTHDDITSDAVAAAFETPIDVRDDARAILAAHYERSGLELNAARLRMARIPDGASLIENPVSFAPGFQIGNVHVMAGVPKIFQAMLEGALATMQGGAPLVSKTLRVEQGEGDIAGVLGDLADRHPELSVGSYPFQRDGKFAVNVVIRGTDGDAVQGAVNELAGALGMTIA
ncbi:MAG: molybdopterin-binding protein, partial [Pseudomonadota bacterium]